MEIHHFRFHIGLPQEVRLLHATDNHLCLADERDGARKITLARNRADAFGASADALCERFRAAVAYTKENRLLYLSTGDILDFVSLANLEFARQTLAGCDYFMAAGNHEYSLYVGEAWEDEAYKQQSFALVQSYFKPNLVFDARIVGGVNFVTLDNVYYNFTAYQLMRMREETKRGFPIILCVHTPFYAPKLYDFMMETDGSCAYLTVAPEEKIVCYNAHRYRQQKADAATLAFADFVAHEPSVYGVIAGHCHHPFEDILPWYREVPMLVGGAGCNGCVTDIIVD